MAQWLLACGLFAREDSLNVPRLLELYFLYRMLEGDRTGLGQFLVNQLYSATTIFAHRDVTMSLITPIARLFGVELNPDDRVTSSERLNLATFEQMKFCQLLGLIGY